MKVQSRLAELRAARGLSAAELASAINVSRQTVYAIESGGYAPNTAIALKLAKALGVTVEEIFQLDAQQETRQTEQVELLEEAHSTRPGMPVHLCRVDGRLIATFPEQGTWSLPVADAVIAGKFQAQTKTSVEIFSGAKDFDKRILLAGCDPGISILSRHLGQQGVDLIVAHRNSTRALELLHQGSIHVAGCHIRDERTEESNLAAVSRIFRKQDIAVVSLALWEEGLVVAHGNPKQIRSISDLERPDVTLVMLACTILESYTPACAVMRTSPPAICPPRAASSPEKPTVASPFHRPRASWALISSRSSASAMISWSTGVICICRKSRRSSTRSLWLPIDENWSEWEDTTPRSLVAA
jgi:DNA-binding XRE family transcriptional regulator